MNSPYVFDTEAIIAYLYNEPGHQRVAELLNQVFSGDSKGFISEMNATEIYYLIARYNGEEERPTEISLQQADQNLRSLARQGIQIERAGWRIAARVKAYGRISLADAYTVSLTYEQEATLVAGADDDFTTLPIDIPILRFRENDGEVN